MSRPQERPDPTIPWKDLTGMTPLLTLREFLLPLPWLIASWMAFATAAWPLGALASVMFFLCALRLNHEAIHNNLGLPRWADDLTMHGLSLLMLGSNNAVAYSHMIHHRHAMGPQDHEGKAGHMGFWRVLAYGYVFTFELTWHALKQAKPARRRKVLIDWGLNAVIIAVAAAAGPQWLQIHVAVMILAQGLTALFAVWITHHGTKDTGLAARSQRGPWARLAYLMFYHREHHLFPAVPVHRLPILAQRLDRDVDGYAAKTLPVIPKGLLRKTGLS